MSSPSGLKATSFALPPGVSRWISRLLEISQMCTHRSLLAAARNLPSGLKAINVRKRLGLPERQIELSDQFIIAHTPRRSVAVVVDAASDVVPYTEAQLVVSETILPGLEHVAGILKLPDGMIFVHD